MDMLAYRQSLYIVHFGFWVWVPSMVGCEIIIHSRIEFGRCPWVLEVRLLVQHLLAFRCRFGSVQNLNFYVLHQQDW